MGDRIGAVGEDRVVFLRILAPGSIWRQRLRYRSMVTTKLKKADSSSQEARSLQQPSNGSGVGDHGCGRVGGEGGW